VTNYFDGDLASCAGGGASDGDKRPNVLNAKKLIVTRDS